MAELERIYTVPLSKAYRLSQRWRARKAMGLLRRFLARHMKTEEGKVRISSRLNELMWSGGMAHPPRKVRVKASKDNEGVVSVTLVEEEFEVPSERKAEAKPVEAVAGMPAEEHSAAQPKESPAQKPAEEAKPPKKAEGAPAESQQKEEKEAEPKE